MQLLVGDHERERTAHELQRHYREGRLSTDELAQRLETALRARNAVQLRSALNELPGAARWADPDALREALRSPARAVRNAAILAGTGGGFPNESVEALWELIQRAYHGRAWTARRVLDTARKSGAVPQDGAAVLDQDREGPGLTGRS